MKELHTSNIASLREANVQADCILPGTLFEHMTTLIDYTRDTPGSFTGRSMLHAYQHFIDFHITWARAEETGKRCVCFT